MATMGWLAAVRQV